MAKLPAPELANAARERWAAINTDMKYPYWDERHSGHVAAVQEAAALNAAQFYETGEPVITDEK